MASRKPTKRPPWTRAGAWTFVYEIGAVRTAKLKPMAFDDLAAHLLPPDVFAALMKGGATVWQDGKRKLTLRRQHVDVIRLMVGEWEQALTAWVMTGRGISLHVMSDPKCPLILQREQKGRYERLIEINAR